MSENTKKILYLHGLGGNTPGPLTQLLESRGYEVVAPDLPITADVLTTECLAEAVRIAQGEVDRGVDLVIGSSRGGAVAMMLKTDKPVILLAPAWKRAGVEPKVPNENTFVIQGTDDEIVPLIESEDLAVRNGIGGNLIVIEDDHRLYGALDVLLMLVEEILNPDEDGFYAIKRV